MAKLMQVEEVSDVTQKPEEFKARYEEVNGRKVLVVSAKAETIVRPDGSQDVIMHVPTLDLVNKFKEENEI